MKKLVVATVLLLMTSFIAFAITADKETAVTFSQLPQKAQQFITKYFDQKDISYAKKDMDLFEGDYEVKFVSGCKVEFKKNGEWREVECKRSEVPAGIIPQRVKDYVAQNHPNEKVIKIERDSREYEVKLSSGTEMKFNLKGVFKRYD